MQTKEQKKELVKNLTDQIKNSKATVFSDFKGLPVKDMTALRKELRERKANLQVIKKTLLNIALKNAGIDLGAKKIEGQVAIATSPEDEVSAAKIIAKTAKLNDNLKISGGLLGKKVLSIKEVASLAKLLSKEELLAKLVSVLNAPIAGIVNVLAGDIRSLVQVLKAIEKTKQS